MYLRLLLSPTPRTLTEQGIVAKGLKTIAAVRRCASKHEFLEPQIRNYLFGREQHQPINEKSAESDGGYSLSEPTSFPALYGNNIQSHVNEVSERQISQHRHLLNNLVTISRPPIPDQWIMQSGWTCYREGLEPERIDYPDEDAMCFDVEVCVRESFAPVLATAVSSTAWYCWVSPVLINHPQKKNEFISINNLIPLGNQSERPRVIVGHFVCYDSARVLESYDLPMSNLKYFDTMAAHVSVSGITDLQKFILLKSSPKPEWANLTSSNSLSQLHELYCGRELDKAGRDVFVKGSLKDVINSFQNLCTYCALDVQATHSVFCKVFPLFLERFPHGATLSAIMDMSCLFLPAKQEFHSIVKSIEENSAAKEEEAKLLLRQLAEDALELMCNENYKKDPWMWDQDWSVSAKKKKVLSNSSNLFSGSKAYPEWYRKLAAPVDSKTLNEEGIPVTFRMNIAAKLMQLCWGSYPLHYERSHGWGMLIPASKVTEIQPSAVPVSSITKLCNSYPQRPRVSSVPTWRDYATLQFGVTATNSSVIKGIVGYKAEENYTEFYMQNGLLFKKLPHSFSLEKNVGAALSLHLLLNPSLRSENEKSQKILDILRKNLFWKRNGKDFRTLPIVWRDEGHQNGAVIPPFVACSDFTRHPKEQVFTPLCLESSESVGTEVSKALEAPDGWCFLSANMPDADMWVASLLADSLYGEYNSSPLGQMFADGSVYLNVAEHMNLTILQAEWVTHAVLWGANRRFLAKALREINPVLSKFAAFQKADKLLKYMSEQWTESESDIHADPGGLITAFQLKLSEILKAQSVETPFLNSRLSRVLESDCKKFSPLIQNWLIRSSVVDYLHIVMLCFRDFLPTARMCSVSSFKVNVKYLVPENQKFYAARSLHLAHLYATAYCAAQMGLTDVPKIAAELPYVTLGSNFREDFSHDLQKLSYSEALMLPKVLE